MQNLSMVVCDLLPVLCGDEHVIVTHYYIWRSLDTFPFQNCKPGISLNYLHHQTTLEIGRMLKGVV